MAEKISPTLVVQETLSLCWQKKWLLTGLMLAGFAPLFIGGAMLYAVGFDDISSIIGVILFLCAIYIISYLFVLTSTSNLGIMLQRRKKFIFSKQLLANMGDVFGRGVIAFLALIGITAVFMFLSVILTLILGLAGVFLGDGIHWLQAIVFVMLGVVAFAYGHRVCIMIAGASIGVKLTLAKAFEVTEGHTLRMALTYAFFLFVALLFSLPPLIIEAMDVSVPFAGESIVGVFCYLASLFVSTVVMYVSNAVWFEKFRLRYNRLMAKKIKKRRFKRKKALANKASRA